MQKHNTKFSINKYFFIITLLFIASFIAVLPHILIGFPITHSFYFNIPWHQYFSEQLFNGELYPRWLFNYIDGLGAPVFYFYAPIPFYLFSFIELMLGDNTGNYVTFTIGHMMIFFLSGIAFFFFISRHTTTYWAAITSILYMFLPYHYIDLEVRAALGESFAYIWIPLIMIGICNNEKTWLKLLFSGFCYAGLILSHLPSALITAPVIAIYSLFFTKKNHWSHAFVHSLFVGIIGVTVSAFYILPAILLQDTLPYDAWVTGSGSHFQASNWLIGKEGINEFSIKIYKSLAISTLLGVCAAFVYGAAFIITNRDIKTDKTISRLVAASLLTLVVYWLLMSTVSEPIWKYFPILPQIQFPWRLGIVIDFSGLLLFSLSVPPILTYTLSLFSIAYSRILIITLSLIACVVLTSYALTIITYYFPKSTVASDEETLPLMLSVEYRTKWLVESAIYLPDKNIKDLTDIDLASKIHNTGIYRWAGFVSPLPTIASLRPLAHNEAITINDSNTVSSSISATLRSPATIRIRKVYYPHWQLKNFSGDNVNIYPDMQTGLIVFDLPAGEHMLYLDRRLLPVEKKGILVSLVSIVACLIWISILAYRKVYRIRIDRARNEPRSYPGVGQARR